MMNTSATNRYGGNKWNNTMQHLLNNRSNNKKHKNSKDPVVNAYFQFISGLENKIGLTINKRFNHIPRIGTEFHSNKQKEIDKLNKTNALFTNIHNNDDQSTKATKSKSNKITITKTKQKRPTSASICHKTQNKTKQKRPQTSRKQNKNIFNRLALLSNDTGSILNSNDDDDDESGTNPILPINSSTINTNDIGYLFKNSKINKKLDPFQVSTKHKTALSKNKSILPKQKISKNSNPMSTFSYKKKTNTNIYQYRLKISNDFKQTSYFLIFTAQPLNFALSTVNFKKKIQMINPKTLLPQTVNIYFKILDGDQIGIGLQTAQLLHKFTKIILNKISYNDYDMDKLNNLISKFMCIPASIPNHEKPESKYCRWKMDINFAIKILAYFDDNNHNKPKKKRKTKNKNSNDSNSLNIDNVISSSKNEHGDKHPFVIQDFENDPDHEYHGINDPSLMINKMAKLNGKYFFLTEKLILNANNIDNERIFKYKVTKPMKPTPPKTARKRNSARIRRARVTKIKQHKNTKTEKKQSESSSMSKVKTARIMSIKAYIAFTRKSRSKTHKKALRHKKHVATYTQNAAKTDDFMELKYPNPIKYNDKLLIKGYELNDNNGDNNLCKIVEYDELNKFILNPIEYRGCLFMIDFFNEIEIIQKTVFSHRLSCFIKKKKRSAEAYNDKLKMYQKTLKKLENELSLKTKIKINDKKNAVLRKEFGLNRFMDAVDFDYIKNNQINNDNINFINLNDKKSAETILLQMKYQKEEDDEYGYFKNNRNHIIDLMLKRIDDVFVELSIDRMNRNTFKSWICKYLNLNKKEYEKILNYLFNAIAITNKNYFDAITPLHIGRIIQLIFDPFNKTTIKFLFNFFKNNDNINNININNNNLSTLSYKNLFNSMINNSHNLFPNDCQLISNILQNKKNKQIKQYKRKRQNVLTIMNNDDHKYESDDDSISTTNSTVSTVTAMTKIENISPIITSKDLQYLEGKKDIILDILLFLAISFRCQEFIDDKIIKNYKLKTSVLKHFVDINIESNNNLIFSLNNLKLFGTEIFKFITPNYREMIESGDENKVINTLFLSLSKNNTKILTPKLLNEYFIEIEEKIIDRFYLVNKAFDFYDRQNRDAIYPSDLLQFEQSILGIILESDLEKMFGELFESYIKTSLNTKLTRKQFQQLFELKHIESSSPDVLFEIPQIILLFNDL